MIEITVINRKIENGLSAVKVEGHSKNITLCNAVSILMKNLEIGFEYASCIKSESNSVKFNVNRPVPGTFEIYYNNTEYTDFLISVFKQTVNWLINQYPDEIKIYEVN